MSTHAASGGGPLAPALAAAAAAAAASPVAAAHESLEGAAVAAQGTLAFLVSASQLAEAAARLLFVCRELDARLLVRALPERLEAELAAALGPAGIARVAQLRSVLTESLARPHGGLDVERFSLRHQGVGAELVAALLGELRGVETIAVDLAASAPTAAGAGAGAGAAGLIANLREVETANAAVAALLSCAVAAAAEREEDPATCAELLALRLRLRSGAVDHDLRGMRCEAGAAPLLLAVSVRGAAGENGATTPSPSPISGSGAAVLEATLALRWRHAG